MPSFRHYTPSLSDDTETLADWMELEAIRSENGTASLRELAQTLHIAGNAEAPDEAGDENDEANVEPRDYIDRLDHVIDALQWREASCGEGAYPYMVSKVGTSLTRRSGWKTSVYIFQRLLCGYSGESRLSTGKGLLYNARLFEALSVVSAGRYLGERAKTFHFAFPRPDKSNFQRALSALASATGGQPLTRLISRAEKDDGLDVFAWRPFPDDRSNYVCLFGQCAGGSNWDLKAPQPLAFLGKWIGFDTGAVLGSLFMPRMMTKTDFVGLSKVTLVFDRCRIAALVPNFEALGPKHVEYTAWMASALTDCGARAIHAKFS